MFKKLDSKRSSRVTQRPETISEFGHLEPICQVCGRPLTYGFGLVTYNLDKQGEIIKSSIKVTCKGWCDDRNNRYSREAEWVFDDLPKGKAADYFPARPPIE